MSACCVPLHAATIELRAASDAAAAGGSGALGERSEVAAAMAALSDSADRTLPIDKRPKRAINAYDVSDDLQCLSLRGTVLDAGTAKAIALTLPKCPELREIKFWNVTASPDDFREILTALQHEGSQVRRVAFDYCTFRDPADSQDSQSGTSIGAATESKDDPDGPTPHSAGVVALLRSIHPNARLQCISLRGNCLTDDDLPEMCIALLRTRSLRVLDLSRNHITGKGAAQLMAALRDCRGIEGVSLAHNRIGSGAGLGIETAGTPEDDDGNQGTKDRPTGRSSENEDEDTKGGQVMAMATELGRAVSNKYLLGEDEWVTRQRLGIAAGLLEEGEDVIPEALSSESAGGKGKGKGGGSKPKGKDKPKPRGGGGGGGGSKGKGAKGKGKGGHGGAEIEEAVLPELEEQLDASGCS